MAAPAPKAPVQLGMVVPPPRVHFGVAKAVLDGLERRVCDLEAMVARATVATGIPVPMAAAPLRPPCLQPPPPAVPVKGAEELLLSTPVPRAPAARRKPKPVLPLTPKKKAKASVVPAPVTVVEEEKAAVAGLAVKAAPVTVEDKASAVPMVVEEALVAPARVDATKVKASLAPATVDAAKVKAAKVEVDAAEVKASVMPATVDAAKVASVVAATAKDETLEDAAPIWALPVLPPLAEDQDHPEAPLSPKINRI